MSYPFLLVIYCLVLMLAGCSKSGTSQTSPRELTENAKSNDDPIDPCALLTSEEIESVQGEPLKGTTPSARSEAGFAIAQCYFALPTSANSIALSVTRRGDKFDARDPKEFWQETFHHEQASGKGSDNEKGREEEKERSAAPEKIPDLGDEAFWMGNRVWGALYVLKGNRYLRIGVGGSGDKASKLEKSKALARIILNHL